MEKLKKVYGYTVAVDENGRILYVTNNSGRYMRPYRVSRFGGYDLDENMTLEAFRAGVKRKTVSAF